MKIAGPFDSFHDLGTEKLPSELAKAAQCFTLIFLALQQLACKGEPHHRFNRVPTLVDPLEVYQSKAVTGQTMPLDGGFCQPSYEFIDIEAGF